MNISTTGYLYCYTACLIYILSSVICGVIRWFHMCHPYDRNADYFYPGRKQALFFYSALLLQLPYLLWPDSPDTWTYVRVFGMLYYPVCFSMLFLRYFRGEQHHKKLRRALISVLPLAWIVFGFVQAIIGGLGFRTSWTGWIDLAIVIGMVYTSYLMRIVWWLRQKIRLYQQNHYSNDEDFPYRFARRVLFVPLVWLMAMWVLFVTDSPSVKVVVDLLCSIMHVWLLILILHPHWNLTLEETQEVERQQNALMNEIVTMRQQATEADSIEVAVDKNPSILEPRQQKHFSDEHKKALREKVITLIKDKELFKQPNLKLNDLAAEVDSNCTYLYKAFSQDKQQGTFYHIVNAMRVQRCKELLLKNPAIDQYDLMAGSGFNSISTFYRVFKTFTGHTPKMWVKRECSK